MWSITKIFILQIICIMLLGGIKSSHALVRRYTFVVQESSHTRLCTTKTMLTVNGSFPGPTIYANKGDLVIVDVINRAGQNITIHWHGVKMPRYPWSDGPEFVTQCPIRPGTRFRQRVVLSDEEGTLWWHAHSEWSRASVYGALIILPEKNQPYPFPKPHAEVPILLGEWWNSDVQEVMEEFLANGGDPNVSDAFLINGQPGDLYSCSRQDTYRLTVEFGRTYLIRMVNAVMNNIMFFRIANHNITIVGSDAAYTKQFSSDYITISPGQTIDFLLEANQPPSHYYMASRAYASRGNFDNTTTTGILQYSGNYTIPSSPPLPTFPEFNDTSASVNFTTRLRSLANAKYPIDVPLNVTDILFFTLSINVRPCPLNAPCDGPRDERLLASVNNVTMVLPRTDILQAYYRNISGVYENDFPDNPPFPYNYTQEFVPRDLSRPEDGTAVQESSHTRLCTTKTMLTVNGSFPGPTIYANKGDLVIVDVINNATQNLTIHWHGVKMPRYPWSDGPEFVTQCPIRPGKRFSQWVVLSDEVGTLWWHAHSDWSRATNSDIQEVMEEFLATGGDPNVSDAFLINGQPGDLYPCSKPDTFNMIVESGKTYLIRMINAVMNNIMFFRIANHTITVVGSDGAYTKQFISDYIAISPGQTIDFLLEANQPPSHYYMASHVYASAGNFDNTTTTGILQYAGNYTIPSSPPLPSLPDFTNTLASTSFTGKLRSLANNEYPIDVPLTVSTKLFFTLSINIQPCVNTTCLGPFGERFLASVNNVSLVLPRTDILQAYYRNISGVYENDFPDNPPFPFNYTQGVWFLHCHFERHVSWGMGMVFIVKNGNGPNATMLPPPSDMPQC
ncbi:hypothetical protein ACJIZ3_003254 [Penstemon smallii]|uniref:Laccase n=1 Tax=Penstemon smallii TaxID=265156 RepID=A0ABD3UAP9_9LAMI